MRQFNIVTLITSFSLAMLIACGTVRVEDGGSGLYVLSYELSAIDSSRHVGPELMDKAWATCPNGWEQVIDPKRNYVKGDGVYLRFYRAEGGSFGLYQTKIRCKAA